MLKSYMTAAYDNKAFFNFRAGFRDLYQWAIPPPNQKKKQTTMLLFKLLKMVNYNQKSSREEQIYSWIITYFNFFPRGSQHN